MEKRINGIAIVITGVSNGRNALAVDSFWINKIKEGHPDTANSAGKSTPDPTSETRTGEVLPKTNISQIEENSKPKNLAESPADTILNAGQGPAAENPAVDADAETKAVKTLLQPAKERETARKRLADTLARQIIVNKDGWTQADMEEAQRIRGLRRKTNARSVGYSE